MDNFLLERIKLYFTANMFRAVAVAALIGFVGVFVYAVKVDSNNPPPADMRFPVSQAVGKPKIQGEAPDFLSAQTLSSREVARHLSDVVAESLSFNKDNFAASAEAMRVYFTPTGYKQYREFLSSSAFETSLNGQNLQSGAYLEGEPLEITRGVFGGVYKWVMEAPVTISFTPRGSETYRNESPPENRRITLRLQFTRVESAKNLEDVKIEIWQVMAPRRSK